MSKSLFTYPQIASLGVTPYVLDLRGSLALEFFYTRATTDTVIGPNGEEMERLPNQYLPDHDSTGLNLGMRFVTGEDLLLWQPTPAVYTIFIEYGDLTVDVRTVIIGAEGLIILPASGKTHIRRIGVNRQPDVETPGEEPGGGQLPIVSLPTELVVAEGETLTITITRSGSDGICSVGIAAKSGVA